MVQSAFEKVFNDMVEQSRRILIAKGAEYANDGDRLINFKQAAHLEGVKQSTALAGMMAKHTVSIYDMIAQYEAGTEFSQEKWDEKLLDHFNYLILLQAVLTEERMEKVRVKRVEAIKEALATKPTVSPTPQADTTEKICMTCRYRVDHFISRNNATQRVFVCTSPSSVHYTRQITNSSWCSNWNSKGAL